MAARPPPPPPTCCTSASPFAPLELSSGDVETLEALSRVIIRNYVAQYEAFATRGGVEGVDKRSWRFVKQLANVRAFVQRKARDDDSGSDGTDELARTVERYSTSSTEALAPSDLPVVLIAGSVPGTLDDFMYGVVAPTADVSLVRTAYVNDDIGETAVLATLAAPTLTEPFQTHLVRWVHLVPHNVLGRVASDRDFVYMERTGIAQTSSGERIGFQMLHSVNFPQTHEIPAYVRGNMSSCGIYRHNAERNHVEVYLRVIVDARGSVLRPVVVLSAVDAYIAIAKYMDIAVRKKLMWHVRQRRRKSAHSSTSERLERDAACAICERSVSKTQRLWSRDLSKYECALCAKCVCSSCRVRKTLCRMVAATGKVASRKLSFCCVCYGSVCRASAFAVAQQEIVAAAAESGGETPGGDGWSDSHSSSLSSE